MTRTTFITTLAVLAIMAGGGRVACSQETLKVAIPQRGAWDAGVAELGQRGGIFKKHGLDLEVLYVQAGPESIQAVIGGSMDIATAAGVSAAVGTFAKGAPIRIIGSEMIGARPISIGTCRPTRRSGKSKISTARPSRSP